MPVIVLAGEEEFSLNKRLAQLKKELINPAWLTTNLVKLQKPSFDSLQQACGNLPFGDGKRMVVVENCDLFTKKKSKSEIDSKEDPDKSGKKAAKVDDLDQFESVLNSVPQSTYLIFVCPFNFDAALKTSKLVAKYAELEDFVKEKYFPGSRNLKLESFCRQEAKKHGATIDDAALDYLLRTTEGDLRLIASEIDKASLAILPQNKITYDIVASLCSDHGHIFQFVDYWLKGQKNLALKNLLELLAQQNAMPIIAALQTMLSKWIRLKGLYENYQEKSLSRSDIVKKIATDLKLMSFSLEKDLDRLQNISAAELVDKRLQLNRLEYGIKVGQIPADHALTLFVLSK